MLYPVVDPEYWARVTTLPRTERLALALREIRARWRPGKKTAVHRRSVTIRKRGAPLRPLAAHDLPLLCIGRNSRDYLALFLRHYRGLGVTRFIILDDGSDDGTPDLLLQEQDVDVHVSNVGYRQAASGMIWRDMLIDLYGRGRWYVSVDADEFLLYPGAETTLLPAFIARLEARGLLRCMAPMLDIYPDGLLGAANYAVPGLASPLEVSPLIDGDGYSLDREKFCTAVRGGPRRRLFQNDLRLSKFPLIFCDGKTGYDGASIHGPFPFVRNFAAARAVLLHAKFSARSLDEFREIVARGAHYGNSLYYRQIVDSNLLGPDLDLRYPASRRVGDTAELVRMGFMIDS